MQTKLKFLLRTTFLSLLFLCVVILSKAQCTVDVYLPAVTPVCGPCPWIISANATGGTPPYIYMWSNGATAFQLATCTPGIYTVTVTDGNGCFDTATTNIIEIDSISMSVETHNPTCPGNCDGWVVIHGGYPGMQYDLNGMTMSDSIFHNLCAGTYQASIFGGSCYDSEMFTLESSSCFCDTSNANCQIVCERNVTNYTAPFHTGSNYQWTVNGAINYTTNINHISVTWNDDSVNNGYGTIQYIETLANGTRDSLQICYRISDAPSTSFVTQPAAVGGVVNICSGVNVSFVNETTGASSYFWDFGNGNTSTSSDPSFAFNQTGNFVVHLTTTGDCGCSTEDSILVHVIHAPGPDVQCASVVCANDTATYNTSTVCSVYNWSVTGGTILSTLPYGSAIVVAWGDGSAGNGSVTLDVGTCTGLCATPTTISIPIVSPNASISGDALVCTGDVKTYTVANIPGTTFTWTVSNGGTIASGQGSNSILVNWGYTGGTYNVSVNYSFDLLECSGSGNLPVKIAPHLYAITNNKFCFKEGEGELYASLSGYSGNYTWIVKDPDGNESTFISTSPLTYNWTMAGSHTVTITPNPPVAGLSCNDSATSVFNVIEIEKPSAINGEQLICPGSTYEYTAAGLTNGVEFYWSVTGGILSSTTGDYVTVTWNASGPYALSVKHRQLALPNCESKKLSITVAPYSIQGITGSQNVCSNGNNTYSILGISKPEIYYQWTVTPSLGSVISGQGTPNITIEWLNATGIATVTVTALNCNNQTATLNAITVHLPASPAVTPPLPSFCHGNSVVLTSSAALSYSWADSAGVVISNQQNANVTYGGYFILTTTDANGCKADTSVFVNENPAPEASISTPGATVFCIPDPVNGTLYALTATGYSYEWLLNGSTAPGSANSPTYNVTQAGSYSVIVTNSFNCTAASNEIEYILQNCPPPNCFVNDFVDFVNTDCDPIQFSGSVSSASVTNLSWLFDDPLSGSNNASGINASHNFSSAGYFHVLFSGSAPNLSPPPPTCPIGIEHVVAVYANADFKFVESCAGTATQFTDLSTWLPGYPVTAWSWDFGDLTSTSAQQSPAHIYAAGGIYTVSLTITSSVCSETVTRQVKIPGLVANASYIPNPVCSGTPVNFSDLTVSQDSIIDWLWDFGDATTSANQHPNKTYSTSGIKTVVLTVTDIAGCVNSYSFNADVNPLPSAGTITPPGPVSLCRNQSVSLIAPPGIAWEWTSGELTQNVSENVSGSYSVVVTTSNNCIYLTPPVEINKIPMPRAEIISGNHNVCIGESTTLQAYQAAGYSYEWFSVGSTGALSTLISLPLSLSAAGTYQYYLVVTGISGNCTDTSDVFTITVHDLPATPLLNILPAGNNCGGNNVVISISNPENDITYNWSNGLTSYYNGGSVPSITTNITGNYTVTATDSSGCSSTSQPAVINQQPDFSSVLTGCYEFCDTSNVFLHAPQGYAGYNWLRMVNGNWVSVSNSINFLLTNDGVYVLVLTTFEGCSDTSDVLTINQYHCCNMIVNAHGSILNCYGDTNGTATVDSPTGAGIFYYWSTGATSQTISGLSLGTVWVTVYDALGCKTLVSILVKSPSEMPVPVITNNGDTIYSSVMDSVFNYQWYNNGFLISGADSMFYISTTTGCYTVLITDANGCTAVSDSVCIPTGIQHVFETENNVAVFPNPFHDNIIVITGDDSLKEIELFDVTGRMVLKKSFENETTVSMRNFGSSVYFYRVKNTKEILRTGKLLKAYK